MRRATFGALLMLAGFGVAAPRWHQVSFPYPISVARLDSDSTGWAAGTAGPGLTGFFRCDGGEWLLTDTIRNQLIYDIAIPGETAWAVGEQFNFPDGVVYRRAGGQWQQQPDPFDRALQAVSFAGPEHGFAGGASPVHRHPAMRFVDGEWRIDSTLTTNHVILGMHATYQAKCLAVGDSGSIFKFQDTGWTELRPVTAEHLRRVDMESNTEGWAVGNRGVILRCFKDTWAAAPSPTTRNLRGLSVAGTTGEAWAVGDSGTILHWTRDPFVPSPPDVPLYTVTFTSGSQGWAFGHSVAGATVALHYYDDSTGVDDDRTGADVPRSSLGGTVLRDARFLLTGASDDDRPVVLNSLGCRAADARGLSPGVYFVRAGTGTLRRVVLVGR